MRIAYVCGRLPYPPVTGGQRDTFNRGRELRQLGHDIVLIAVRKGDEPEPDPAWIAAVEREIGRVVLVDEARGLAEKIRKIANLWRSPLLAVAIDRTSLRKSIDELRAFSPNVIWMDYIFMLPFVQQLAASLCIRVAMRSHNIEHRYRRVVARASHGLKSSGMAWLRSVSVRTLEFRAARLSSAIYDISVSDMPFWEEKAPGRVVRWLPPVFSFPPVDEKRAITHDVAFLGSLATSTNIEGLIWFFDHVHPVMVARHPGFSVLIGGSRPSEAFARKLRAIPDVELRRDVTDPAEVWAAAKVLINPVLSGEGVNIKAIEMLGFDRPMVTTPLGVRGFPPVVCNAFLIGDTAQAFADLLDEALKRPAIAHARARDEFGIHRFGAVIGELGEVAMDGNKRSFG